MHNFSNTLKQFIQGKMNSSSREESGPPTNHENRNVYGNGPTEEGVKDMFLLLKQSTQTAMSKTHKKRSQSVKAFPKMKWCLNC